MAQIPIRLDENLKEEFRDYCDENGTDMSNHLREHIRSVTGTSETDPLPDDPELAKAYRRMYDVRSSDDRIPVAEIEPELANHLNIPKRTIRRRILHELDERGYINVSVGIISLNVPLEPDHPDQTDATTHEVPADD